MALSASLSFFVSVPLNWALIFRAFSLEFQTCRNLIFHDFEGISTSVYMHLNFSDFGRGRQLPTSPPRVPPAHRRPRGRCPPPAVSRPPPSRIGDGQAAHYGRDKRRVKGNMRRAAGERRRAAGRRQAEGVGGVGVKLDTDENKTVCLHSSICVGKRIVIQALSTGFYVRLKPRNTENYKYN
ncbi:hypothetical protein GGX14DRAFT_677145 [Mycena pura]|uniref:Uncharacterized protein n=1 Tax=Mycena pura TaxID=153505 RepID=A0AAD6UYS0_9AGAR|nr:hypothetical protein GGX14DRAFT_677145 [Mycena pura]